MTTTTFDVPADSVYAGIEYDIGIAVTFRGVAAQITARGTFDGDVMAEANDLRVYRRGLGLAGP